MSTASSRQAGFSVIEGLLILVIVAIVAFVGYYIHHASLNSYQTYNNASSSASSSAPHVTPKKTGVTTPAGKSDTTGASKTTTAH